MINGLPYRLRVIREKHKFSQRDVANMLDVSPSLISSYETGERTPSVDVLLRLSDLYRCSIDYLLGKEADCDCISFSLDEFTPTQIHILLKLIEEFRFQHTEHQRKQEI